ncbi:hypothetical protein ABZ636_36485 [Streptomyces sp. NPDC007251]|uniref:hypothetical protein n=1 Tax=Streptomyces sp. NPDC007251 TaxID=3154483 RepID=UPI0033FBA296
MGLGSSRGVFLAQRNAKWLGNWAGSRGWWLKPNSNVQKRGYIDSDGNVKWMLALTFQGSHRPGLQAGSNVPRFDARPKKLGEYTNPLTGQKGPKADLLPQSSVPGANLGHIPLDDPWAPKGTIDLARSTAKVGGQLLPAGAVAYDIYHSPAPERLSVVSSVALCVCGRQRYR